MRATHAQKLAAARVFARHGTQQEAADAAGVSRQAVARWQKKPSFVEMVAGLTKPIAPVVPLEVAPRAEPPSRTLAPDWRQASATELAAGVPIAVRCVIGALDSDDPPTKAQLDTARWVIERMGIVAPEEVPAEEITTSDEMADALASECGVRLLELALERARGLAS